MFGSAIIAHSDFRRGDMRRRVLSVAGLLPPPFCPIYISSTGLMKRSILISSSPVSQLCSSFKMSTHYLWRSRPQKAILTFALSGVGSLAVASYFTRNAFADDGDPATVFPSKFGTSLRLESSESVNHNTKRLRFEFPNPTARSGLTLTCTFLFPDIASISMLIMNSDCLHSILAEG
jgi:hypothetical protein